MYRRFEFDCSLPKAHNSWVNVIVEGECNPDKINKLIIMDSSGVEPEALTKEEFVYILDQAFMRLSK